MKATRIAEIFALAGPDLLLCFDWLSLFLLNLKKRTHALPLFARVAHA
jgi:hypothetical protein